MPIGFNAKVENINDALYSFKSSQDFNSIEIIGDYGFTPLNNDSKKRFITIFETPFLRLNFAKSKNTDDLISYFLSVKELLSFVLQEHIYPTRLRGKISSGKIVEIYLAYGKHDPIEKSNQNNCLFTLEDLLNNKIELPKLILDWNKSSKRYSVLHENYNYRIKYKNMPFAPAILGLLIGLESYINIAHGKNLKNEINADELKSVKAQVKKLDKKSILRELILNDLGNYSKRTSLKSKYLILMNNYLGNLEITEEDIDLMIGIRNDLAHGNNEIDQKFDKGKEADLPRNILKLNNFALLESLQLSSEFITQVLSKPY